MSSGRIWWRDALHTVAAELEARVDRAALTGAVASKIVIAPYRGFGRQNELLIRGRVLAEKAVSGATSAEPV